MLDLPMWFFAINILVHVLFGYFLKISDSVMAGL